MSLINCPECGGTVSDKAKSCPKCGYPLSEEFDYTNELSGVVDKNSDESKTIELDHYDQQSRRQEEGTIKKFTKQFLFGGGVVLTLSIIAFALLLYRPKTPEVEVEQVELLKWNLVEDKPLSKKYEGILTSETKDPFVAVVGYNDHPNVTPKLVYMEEGKGILQES